MKLAEACEALKSHQCIEVSYAGSSRIVEVHAAGYTREQKPIMRVWQVRGGSKGGNTSGWKLFRIDEVGTSKILDEKSKAPRSGYRKGDPAITAIVCEL